MCKWLLVDCGATTHIVHDSKFTRFNQQFNPEHYYIELADGSRSNNVALKRGDANVELCDGHGNVQTALLKNALYVPSYKQDIFSVQAATSRGATVSFTPDRANGTEFDIKQNGKLYYLNSVVSSSMSRQQGNSKSLREWHEILGHCNLQDIFALENVVDGMRVTGKKEFDCETCVMGKMTRPKNRKPDRCVTMPLELVHCNLAGPVDPIAREGFTYALAFVDDYSGMIMIYFLQNKSDTPESNRKILSRLEPLC